MLLFVRTRLSTKNQKVHKGMWQKSIEERGRMLGSQTTLKEYAIRFSLVILPAISAVLARRRVHGDIYVINYAIVPVLPYHLFPLHPPRLYRRMACVGIST